MLLGAEPRLSISWSSTLVGYRIDNEILPEEVPEQRLWKAVIDRALRDYVHFYRISLGFTYPFPKTDTKSLFKHYRAAPVQFKCLVWFLFEPTEPHNLEYLVDEFYECDGLVERIRDLARNDFTKEKQEILTAEWAKPLVEKYRRLIERKEREEGKESILRLLFY
jgi:hypothetical protein